MLRRLLEGLSLAMPSQCAVCGSWPSHTLCSPCVARFAQPLTRCGTCALPVPAGMRQCGRCITAPPPLDAALAAVPYSYPWAHVVQAFKFQQRPAWARQLAALIRSAPWVEPALDAADVLIPLPLHPLRLRERGFNQALLLAQALAPHKTHADALLRIRHAPPQHSLPRKERLTAMQGAFALNPDHHTAMRQRRVVLVDDVMTTGASVHAAAQALRAAGAAHITALVFARTE